MKINRIIIQRSCFAIIQLLVVAMCFAQDKDLRPNIVLFIADDHGYRHSSVYGDPNVNTPNMDQLASEGMRLTYAFAASPLCSPSRSAIHTGMYPHRSGAHKFGTRISAGLKTTPEYFREAGYNTIHVGKFHHFAAEGDTTQFRYDQRIPDEFTIAEVIENVDLGKPLLLVICSHDSHTPWLKNTRYNPDELKLPPNFVDTPESRNALADFYTDVESIDTLIGTTLSALEKRNILDNTVFIYTADQGSQLPFGKWCLYDDGIRVPLMARWPGKIQANSVSDAMVSLIDILPTVLEAAGTDVPSDIDGESFLDVLVGTASQHRDMIFASHTGNDHGNPEIINYCPTRAVRTQTHKYILNLESDRIFQTHTTGGIGNSTVANPYDYWGSWVRKGETDPAARRLVQSFQHRSQEELFDLEKDTFEQNNRIDDPEMKPILNQLRKTMGEWRKQQGDDVPMNTGPYVIPERKN